MKGEDRSKIPALEYIVRILSGFAFYIVFRGRVVEIFITMVFIELIVGALQIKLGYWDATKRLLLNIFAILGYILGALWTLYE